VFSTIKGEAMKIRDAEAGTTLRGSQGFLVIGHNLSIKNEIGMDIYPRSYDEDFEVVYPKPIMEHAQYTAEVHGRPIPKYLILKDFGGEMHGYRHRINIHDYALKIGVSFTSSDPRVGRSTQGFHISSGGFLLKAERDPDAIWTFTTGDFSASLKIHSGTSWINVPSQ
jgi:hypothetical protein